MGKVAIITDTHAGVRSESPVFFDAARDFYRDVFFPEAERRGIKTVVHLGDLVHRSRYVAFYTLNRLRRDFIEPLIDAGLELVIVPGNHDAPYKTRLSVNAEREILPPHPRVRVLEQPQTWVLPDLPVLMLPWICDENRQASLDLISRRPCRVAMGHLELAGFEMYRGLSKDHGMSASLFDGYDMVLSGHYHHPSQRGAIRYLGAPFQMDWNDHGCARGFHVLDTSTLELEFVENPKTMFEKVVYPVPDPDGAARACVGKMVKLIVRERGDVVKYDAFVEHLESVAASVKVVDDHRHADQFKPQAVELDDTYSLIRQCVAESSARVDKTQLDALMLDLYSRVEQGE